MNTETVKAIWFVPPVLHVLASRFGFLADAGFAVDATATGSSDEQFAALRAGGHDLAVTAMDNVILWNKREEGDDYRVVAQIEATTAISLVARPEFRTVADLRGARLLVDSATNGFVVALRALLDDAGIGFEECAVATEGGVRERYAALVQGRGDATLLGPPFVAMAEQAGMTRLADVERAYPGFPGQGVVVRMGADDRRLAAVACWLGALERARARSVADRAAAVASLVAGGMDAALATLFVAAVGDTLAPSRGGIDLLVAQRRRLGLPGARTRYEDLVDPSLLAVPAAAMS